MKYILLGHVHVWIPLIYIYIISANLIYKYTIQNMSTKLVIPSIISNCVTAECFETVLILCFIIIITYVFTVEIVLPNPKVEDDSLENFGALQSLYSNSGIQDAYLTVENDPDAYYDPYNYWRNINWNLPTRNLLALSAYPYIYDRYIDRYDMRNYFW